MSKASLQDVFKVKELRNRILFTLAVLVLFRFGAQLPLPGINPTVLKESVKAASQSGGFSLASYFDFLSGGAFSNLSIFMLSIAPYISTSIFVQILTFALPALKRLQEEESGRRQIRQYTRYGTILVSIVQSFLFIQYILTQYGSEILTIDKPLFMGLAMLSTATATMFLLWMGEQINQKGIGNGVSLLIFTGIISALPTAVYKLILEVNSDRLNPVFLIILLAVFISTIVFVILEQKAQRRITVQYARHGGSVQNAYIPLKLNPAGVIPVIFASAILSILLQVLASTAWYNTLGPIIGFGSIGYMFIEAGLIIFFTYFYTQLQLNPSDMARRIRENGGIILGVRAEDMESFLTKTINRLLLSGSLFLAIIAVIPSLVQLFFNIDAGVARTMGGTSLLIMVGVNLDTLSQIQAFLKMNKGSSQSMKKKLSSKL